MEENCSSSTAIISVSEHCHCFACAVRCHFASVLGSAQRKNGGAHWILQCMPGLHSRAAQRVKWPLNAGGSTAQQVQVGSPVMYASTFLHRPAIYSNLYLLPSCSRNALKNYLQISSITQSYHPLKQLHAKLATQWGLERGKNTPNASRWLTCNGCSYSGAQAVLGTQVLACKHQASQQQTQQEHS